MGGRRRRTSPADWMRAEASLDIPFVDMMGWTCGLDSRSEFSEVLDGLLLWVLDMWMYGNGNVEDFTVTKSGRNVSSLYGARRTPFHAHDEAFADGATGLLHQT